MNEKNYFRKEKEEILSRIFKVMQDKKLSNADVARRLNYSPSKVSKVLSGNQELSLEFVFSFATAFCNGDYCYFLLGVRKSTSTALVDLFKNIPFDEQDEYLSIFSKIIQVSKTSKKKFL